MLVRVNGIETDLAEGSSVQGLIDSKRIKGQVIVELNGAMVRPEAWPGTVLQAGDDLNFIKMVFGG